VQAARQRPAERGLDEPARTERERGAALGRDALGEPAVEVVRAHARLDAVAQAHATGFDHVGMAGARRGKEQHGGHGLPDGRTRVTV
jgi:hypothetical protein